MDNKAACKKIVRYGALGESAEPSFFILDHLHSKLIDMKSRNIACMCIYK